jgi:excinuclease ABC subunit A
LQVLHGFVEGGNSVLVIEHNLDVVKTADWIIDLGPEGGSAGGKVVAQGTPEQVAAKEQSYTGQALRHVLQKPSPRPRVAARGRKPRHAANGQITHLTVQGAQQHNLKNITVEMPREQMTVFCGPSGSGKSSLALDTIYAEGQRRYLESLSSYARQFLGQVQKPKVDHVSGLSPAISIEQKTTSRSPRSTVGTVTEIYDYLRILYARLGQPYCPACGIPIGTQTTDEIIDKVMSLPDGTKLYLMAPLERRGQEKYESLFDEIRRNGFVRMRVDGTSYNVEEPPTIDHRRKHSVEIVIDRIIVRGGQRGRIADAVEAALELGSGVMHVVRVDDAKPEPQWPVERFSQHLACDKCGRSFEPLNPHHFSFNSPLGWCPACEGLGVQKGANPALLIRDPHRSLRAGALTAWPDLTPENPFTPFAEALARHAGFSLDTPFEELPPAQQRTLFHGTGEAWISAEYVVPGIQPGKSGRKHKGTAAQSSVRFQYKGIMPALDEASRVSAVYRQQLDHLVNEVACSTCGGSRLRDDAAAWRIVDRTLGAVCGLPLSEVLSFFKNLKLSKLQRQVAGELLREITNRLQFLVDVGLEYLTLSRPGPTLSGGEAQRIRLASQIGSGLTGVLYVLDEPTIGLHPRDNRRLLGALTHLRDLGNTLVLVEHDREVIGAADYLLDFGPGAGDQGGEITARGNLGQVLRSKGSLTGQYLSQKKSIPVPTNRRLAPRVATRGRGAAELIIRGARQNNLQNIDVTFPLGAFITVTGVSGSGKSSLIQEVLYNTLARRLHRARTVAAAFDDIVGLDHIDKVISVDQDPIGNSPSSNPATYTGVFDLVRQLFAQLPESKVRGYRPQRFSFNKPGGRCEACEGNGQKKIEMHFLPDVWVECDVCHGKRYNLETLAVHYKGHTIADVLNLRVHEALEVFGNIPKIRRVLQTLEDVGLGYLSLGQPAPTLSGGESQRVKLAAELGRPNTGRTLYILDEPTTGLHFDDVAKLLNVLNRLVDLGNTVIVVEHNLDVIKSADWVIDLGPEAGSDGGRIVAEGAPEAILKVKESHTAVALAPVLAAGPYEERPKYDPNAEETPRAGDVALEAVGKDARMPWQIDGRRWHTVDRVTTEGKPARWDGEILNWLDARIHELGEFGDANWSQRNMVEIAAPKKSQGWFFHALTGGEWLVWLVFRVGRNTFNSGDLEKKLGIKPLNETPDLKLEVYGNEPRVWVTNHKGPWQSIVIKIHLLSEIDTPAFRDFLRQAAAAFGKQQVRLQTKPEDVMPWKVNGERWHLSEKGFLPGQKLQWDRALLPRMLDLARGIEPGLEVRWDVQYFITLRVPGFNRWWAQWQTKRSEGLICRFRGKKGQFNLAAFDGLGVSQELDTEHDDGDYIWLTLQDLNATKTARLKELLTEHMRGFRETSNKE